jgi:hypothetical protein
MQMPLTFRTNKEITACQVADCLAMLSALMGWMDSEKAQPIEGNVQTSMESTAIRVLNRLDKIIDDDRHWALPTTDAHYYGVRTIELQHEEMDQKLKYQEFLRQKAIVSMMGQGPEEQPIDVQETPAKPSRRKNQKNTPNE